MGNMNGKAPAPVGAEQAMRAALDARHTRLGEMFGERIRRASDALVLDLAESGSELDSFAKRWTIICADFYEWLFRTQLGLKPGPGFRALSEPVRLAVAAVQRERGHDCPVNERVQAVAVELATRGIIYEQAMWETLAATALGGVYARVLERAERVVSRLP